jgi:hypothetical protein
MTDPIIERNYQIDRMAVRVVASREAQNPNCNGLCFDIYVDNEFIGSMNQISMPSKKRIIKWLRLGEKNITFQRKQFLSLWEK